jgi:hypothetical protein
LTVRALVVVGALAALIGATGGAALSAAFVERGPGGPRGEQGPTGPQGPPGEDGSSEAQALDWEEVWQAIEDDPERFSTMVDESLDPAPADVQTNLEELRATVDGLCSELSGAAALEDVYISC